MGCEFFKTKDGATFIVCRRGTRTRKCAFCARPAQYECDGPRPRRKSGHCDKPMCEEHRTKVGDQELGDIVDTVDFCPECVRARDEQPAQQELFR